jgi:hypothetical protein
MTRKEVARRLGLTVAKVRTIETRALRKLRRLLRWRGVTEDLINLLLNPPARQIAKAKGMEAVRRTEEEYEDGSEEAEEG